MASKLKTKCASCIVRPGEHPQWNEYVAEHPQGTIFHTAEMVAVYESTPHYKPFAVAATDEHGKIVALVVAARVETVGGAISSLASRSIFFASPLCDDSETGVRALAKLLKMHDERMRSHAIFAEVRPIYPVGSEHEALAECAYAERGYDNYIVDLAPDTEQLWKGLGKSNRRSIRRSFEQGVDVVQHATHDTIDQMFEMVCLSYNRSQVPLADIQLFHAALDQLPADSVQVRLAHYEGDIVAGGMCLVYKGLVYAWYGGTRRISGLAPFGCITWDEIRWGSENGQQLYDFGGAGWSDEPYGPREFKSRFGGQLVHYGRYRKVYSPWRLAVAKTAYKVARKFVAPAKDHN